MDESKKINISKAEKRKDIKRLKKEGRYFDIYYKYGEEEYNKLLIKSLYSEIKEYKGNKKAIIKAILWRIKNIAKKWGVIASVPLLIGGAGSRIICSEIRHCIMYINKTVYEDEIEKYNSKIKNYAYNIKSMNLTDAEIFMKVMKDMWESIDGYGAPKKNLLGFFELDLATEEGVGVCRNMSADIRKKLNAINSKYNARLMTVYMGEDGNYILANIEKKDVVKRNENINNNDNKEESIVVESSSESPDIYSDNDDKVDYSANESKEEIVVVENSSENSEKYNENDDIGEDSIKKIWEKYTGNHVVVFVDVPEDNLILVIDPTNPSLGIYKNGKIKMLNNDKDDFIEYEALEHMSYGWNTAGGIIRRYRSRNSDY